MGGWEGGTEEESATMASYVSKKKSRIGEIFTTSDTCRSFLTTPSPLPPSRPPLPPSTTHTPRFARPAGNPATRR